MSNYSYVSGNANLPFSQSIAVPAYGSPVTADSVIEGFRSLADRTAFLSSSMVSRHDTLSSSISSLSQSYLTTSGVLDTRVIEIYKHTSPDRLPQNRSFPIIAGAPSYHRAWEYGIGSGFYVTQSILNDPNGLRTSWSVPINFPAGIRVLGVTASLEGSSGHGGLPTSMPYMYIWKKAKHSGFTALKSFTDASANVAAYEAEHQVSASCDFYIPEDNLDTYYFVLTGEDSSNSEVGLKLSDLSFNWVSSASSSYDGY
jgi:hypothetical protein